MNDTPDRATSLVGALVGTTIAAPTVLGVYPVRLALVGLGFGAAPWVAMCRQLASVVIWALLAIPLLQHLRWLTDANVATGHAALALPRDGSAISAPSLMPIAVPAATLASVSEILVMGRRRRLVDCLRP